MTRHKFLVAKVA